MLIPLTKVLETCGFTPKAILHVGAWDGIEMDDYAANGITTVTFIEAQKSIFPSLLGRIEPYPNAKAIHACVSDKRERVSFNVASNGQSSSILSLGTHSELYPGITYTESLDMTALPLSDILQDEPFNFEFVNIDVQGSELKAIKGMGLRINNVKAFYLEVNKVETYKGCALVGEIDEYLSEHGFQRVLTGEWVGDTWTDALYLRK